MRKFMMLVLLAACSTTPADVAESSTALLEFPMHAGDDDDPFYLVDHVHGEQYYGGPVMTGTVTIQVIAYGWPTVGDSRQTEYLARLNFLYDFLQNLGGSPIANVLTTFDDASGNRPSGNFTIAPLIWKDYDPAVGWVINDSDLTRLTGPSWDDDTLYVFLPGPDFKAATGGFSFGNADPTPAHIHQSCGYHTAQQAGSRFLKYVVVGTPAAARAGGTHCDYPGSNPPNADIDDYPGATVGDSDHMADTLWHEIAEAVVDPIPYGVYQGYDEIADPCSTIDSSVPVGYAQLDEPYGDATVTLNNHRDYALQKVWQNAEGGGCVRRVALNKPVGQSNLTRPIGDFQGDGSGDLVYRNTSTGEVSLRPLGAGSTAGAPITIGTAGHDYQLYAIADFDHDRVSDYLWRNLTTSRMSLWTGVGGPTRELAAAWAIPERDRIEAVGDFDGNGRADILFLELTTNQTFVWLNHGGTIQLSDLVPTSIHPSSGENAQALGSGYGSDGHFFVLWRVDHGTNDPTYRKWRFDGASVTGSDLYVLPGAQIIGIGNPRASLLSSPIATYSGSVFWVDLDTGLWHTIATQPGDNWRYAGTSVVNSQPCMFWYDRGSGKVSRWKLDPSTGVKLDRDYPVPSNNLDEQLIAY
jgi:hypothetical protein